jgi:hypothetical protein
MCWNFYAFFVKVQLAQRVKLVNGEMLLGEIIDISTNKKFTSGDNALIEGFAQNNNFLLFKCKDNASLYAGELLAINKNNIIYLKDGI